jgi:carbamoyltransferase
MMNILGINAFHGDASACLVQDGQLTVAVEEERYKRIKHWAGFPADSIRHCLNMAGIKPQEIDHIAVSFNPKANLTKKIAFTLQHLPSTNTIIDRLRKQKKGFSIRQQVAQALGVDETVITSNVHNLEHHSTHFASTFFLSPFAESAILSIDGMGDFVSTLLGSGNDIHLEYYDRTYFPHSLGFLYNAITLYLGFTAYGDEYKVMGLAPYGQPHYLDAFRRMIKVENASVELNLEFFNHHKFGISMNWQDGIPVISPFHSEKLEEVLGKSRKPGEELTERHQNIAASLQAITEEIIFTLLQRLHDRYPSDNLCMAGGVAMNSVANGKIQKFTPFKRVFVPAGAADNGTCIGAAFYVWHRLLKKPREFQLTHALWGDSFSNADIKQAISALSLPAIFLEEQELLEKVANQINAGKVVGWFQGRMEFGARALGNRSLLADPRRADMRDIINAKIKFREKFRPFAPSILEEFVQDYFEVFDLSVPFMEKVYPVKYEKRSIIPAVTHVDGSGRLQTVSKNTNPLYWHLIHTFFQISGVPLVLNTSLNENEPIVCTPTEALSCFLRTSMDVIVLGNYYLDRDMIQREM